MVPTFKQHFTKQNIKITCSRYYHTLLKILVFAAFHKRTLATSTSRETKFKIQFNMNDIKNICTTFENSMRGGLITFFAATSSEDEPPHLHVFYGCGRRAAVAMFVFDPWLDGR